MSQTLPAVAETWNLADLFEDVAAFERDRDDLVRRIPTLERWKGRLGDSAAVLAEACDAIDDAHRRFAALRTYASLRADRDTRESADRARLQAVDLLGTSLTTRVAYLRPEILALPEGLVDRFLAEEPALAPHAFFLRDLLRRRKTILGPAEERILSETSLLTGGANAVFSLLNNVDLPRREFVRGDGETVRLTPTEFQRLRTSASRDERRRLFPEFFAAYRDLRETLGQNLYNAVRGHLFRVRARGYDSCLAASLDRDNVPVAVYRKLVDQARRHLPVLHRYLELRARALGVERLGYHDLHCPLVEPPTTTYPTGDARRLVLDSLAPLGSGYTAAVERAFRCRWIDWHPSPGKRAGAYANGWAYDAHPFVLLNYTGEFESVSTLTHELGHAMHSYFANRVQPFATADYSIFVAEVASTVNETLLSEHMLARATSADERLFLLGTYLDGIRATLFRQAMFAEFELAIHEAAEKGEALTGEGLSELYLAILREHHGHDRGVLEVDETFGIEWAAVPHFFYDFYVYQYATGIVAATALTARLLDGGPTEAATYIGFLSAGGSDYPLELLRRAGVDLESSEPYAAAFRQIDRRLDEMQALLDSR